MPKKIEILGIRKHFIIRMEIPCHESKFRVINQIHTQLQAFFKVLTIPSSPYKIEILI